MLTSTHRGVSEGDVPPSEARKFSIFETGIVQFGEYFGYKFEAGKNKTKQKQFKQKQTQKPKKKPKKINSMDLTDPNFAFWEKSWLVLLESLKFSHIFFFFLKISQNIFTCAQHWEGDDYLPVHNIERG